MALMEDHLSSTAAQPDESLKCSCGHGLKHFSVSIEHDYTMVGWALQGIGASARPKGLKWRCRRCHEVITQTRDREVINDYWEN